MPARRSLPVGRVPVALPLLWGVTLLMLVSGLTACDRIERPGHPLPEDFQVVTLDGRRLDKEALAGRRWVVNLWVPR